VSSKISGIDSSQVASVDASRAAQRPQDAAGGGSSADNANASHDVQITGTARQLADLDQRVRDLPVVNDTLVNRIRQSIEQGKYAVRPRHVADQLMSLERALKNLPDSAESDGSSESGNPGK